MTKDLEELLGYTPRKPWVYDGEPLEEPTSTLSRDTISSDNDTSNSDKQVFKTSPAQLKATRKYEESIKKDKKKLERRKHQKNYSGAKSFITYEAKIEELHFMKTLIDVVLEWSKEIENFDNIKRPDRKELYLTKK